MGDGILSLLRTQIGSASVLECLWTAIGCLGLSVTIMLTFQAILDLQALHRAADYRRRGPRDIIARGNIRTSVERTVFFLGFVLLGVLAMSSPSAGGRPSNTSLVYGAVMTMIEAILSLSTLLDARDRGRVFRLLYAESQRVERLRHEAEVAARLRERERGPHPTE